MNASVVMDSTAVWAIPDEAEPDEGAAATDLRLLQRALCGIIVIKFIV